jgi:hypothetical protein
LKIDEEKLAVLLRSEFANGSLKEYKRVSGTVGHSQLETKSDNRRIGLQQRVLERAAKLGIVSAKSGPPPTLLEVPNHTKQTKCDPGTILVGHISADIELGKSLTLVICIIQESLWFWEDRFDTEQFVLRWESAILMELGYVIGAARQKMFE